MSLTGGGDDTQTPLGRPNRQRRRQFYGRTTIACYACRGRHTRCDRSWPCSSCVRIGTECTLRSSSPASQLDTGRTGPLFHDFSTLVMGWASKTSNARYYWPDVMAACQQDDQVFDVAMCFAVMHSLPLNETVSTGIPSMAMQAYSRSLKKPYDDITILLMTSKLYVNIELRQGHEKNRDILLRMIFKLIYEHQEQIRARHITNTAIQGSLLQLILLTCSDPGCVPKTHWDAAVTLFLRIAAEKGVPSEIDLLFVELYDISFDLGRDDTTTAAIGPRLTCWERRLDAVAPDPRAPALKYMSGKLRMDWLYWKWQTSGEYYKMHFQAHATTALKQFLSSTVRLPTTLFSNLDLEEDLIPGTIRFAWYMREVSIHTQLKQNLVAHEARIAFSDNIVAFMDSVLATEYGQSTDLELELFGETPLKLLRMRWVMLIVRYLARSSTVVNSTSSKANPHKDNLIADENES